MGDPDLSQQPVQPARGRRLSEDLHARVADDKDPLRQMLRAARAWGRPPSVFLAERQVVTVYRHNAAGWVVRAESDEWTLRDSELALALDAYEARQCRGCGGDLDETTKPENELRYRGRILAACFRCVALEIAQDIKHPHPGALSFTAELRDPEPDST